MSLMKFFFQNPKLTLWDLKKTDFQIVVISESLFLSRESKYNAAKDKKTAWLVVIWLSVHLLTKKVKKKNKTNEKRERRKISKTLF